MWTDLQSRLAKLSSLETRSTSSLKSANSLQANLQADAEPFATLEPKLRRAYEAVRREVGEEEE